MVVRLDTSAKHEKSPLLPYGSKSVIDNKCEKQPEDDDFPAQKKRVLHVVYWLAIFNAVNCSAVSPSLLLYLKHIGLASTTDVSYYMTLGSIRSFVPVVMSAAMGMLSSRIGAPKAFGVCCAMIATGLLGMCVGTTQVAFGVMYTCFYGVSFAVRTVRTVLLTEVVPSRKRTVAMSFHTFCSPFGSLFGPLLWLICEQFRGEVTLLGPIRINEYTLNFFVLACIVSANGALAVIGGRYDGDKEVVKSRRKNASNDIVVPVRLSDGTQSFVDTRAYKRRTLFAFSCIILFARTTMALFDLSFQPILVNHFGVTGQGMGYIFGTISLFGLIPPLVVTAVSTILEDRQIMLSGFLLKLVGVLLFLPLFGPVQKWQVVAGYVLLVKASIFVYTASMSLFTRLLGEMSNGTLLGILSSIQALGYCVVQFTFGMRTLQLFGTFRIAIAGIPIFFGVLTMLSPIFWKQLDPEREFVHVLLREYDVRQNS